ncbi:MAG: acyltransferase family protein, partial [Planctomycetota bacterium]
YYAVFFGFGALYYESRDDTGRLGRAWWASLPLGLFVVLPVSMAFSLGAEWTRDMDEGGRRAIAAGLEVLFTWLMIFGFMGLFRRLLARERRWVRYLSDASYWLYLSHLTLVIAAQILVRDWPLPAFVKFTLVLVGTTALLLVAYRYEVRYTWIGRMLNGPRTRPSHS